MIYDDIALARYIPYTILMKWHQLVGVKDDKINELDLIDYLNLWILGQFNPSNYGCTRRLLSKRKKA